ncbi:MAG: 30S ribosomal protein S30e [Nitrososphaeria archaeon]|nr:30S ribosomal protein S30e [Nitrososphaeria archaeon]NIN53260.1 30S ribosomal protein S30e [Nitrososphaeria archaeon]NIQ33711.1 30S ribosomal protein S30e [Nitrososphaeria archaeon]
MPTHGSITKAGKVRAQTPKIDAVQRTTPTPRKRNRKNYYKRFVLNRQAGQSNGRRPRRRRR